jgi:hypothetical protein
MSFGLLKFDKMATKFKWRQKPTFSKNLNAFFFSKTQKADFSKMTYFLGFPPYNDFTTTQDVPKKIAKENLQRWWIFSKWCLYFFLVLKYVL